MRESRPRRWPSEPAIGPSPTTPDSVEALDGAPGVHSARYAPTDAARIQKLLDALEGNGNRRAHFSAALCITDPEGNVLVEVEGRCDGLITAAPRGDQGFGYDPIFEVAGTDRTFAEMALSEKKSHGHRGRAFALLEPRLTGLLKTNLASGQKI